MRKQARNITFGLLAATLVATGTGTLVAAQSAPVSEHLSEAQAVELALQAQPGTLHEVEKEIEQGKAVFEVEITTAEGEFELILDAKSGEVLAKKLDDDSDSDDADDQDD